MGHLTRGHASAENQRRWMKAPVAIAAGMLVSGMIPCAWADDATTALTTPGASALATSAAGEVALPATNITVKTPRIAKQSTVSSKTDAPLNETPASVSVVNRDQMDAQGVQTVSEAARYVAGVQSSSSMAAAQRYDRFDDIKIRGFDVGSNGMLRDGLRGTTVQAWPRVDPYGLESVEILKGPSSVLYGQNSPGGVVNQITKRPTDEPLHEIQLQTGSYARKQAQFDFSGPISEGSDWSYRLTGLARGANSQFTSVSDDKVFIAPALSWKPDANTTLTFLADYSRDTFGPPALVVPIYGSLRPNVNGTIARNLNLNEKSLDNHRSQYSIAYLFDHAFNNVWSVSSKARYSMVDLVTNTVQGSLQSDMRTLRRTPYFFDIQGNTLSLDNNVKARWQAGPAEFESLAGVDFRRTREDYVLRYGPSTNTIDMYNPIYVGGMLPTPSTSASTMQTSNQTGLYFQQQIKLAQRWILSAGAREDWSATETINRLGNSTRSQTDSAFTWKTGVMYLAGYGISPYASYMTSFNPVLGTNVYGQTFQPTRGKQVEAGVKYQPGGFDGFFTLAVFDLRQQNVQTLDPTNPLNRVQTGEVRSRGVELEGHANITRSLNVIASYTWNALKVTKSNTAAELDKRPTGIPEQMASLWAKYTFFGGPMAGLGIGVGVRYMGSTYADTANAISVPSYTLIDLAADMDLGRLSPSLRGTQLAVNVTNLFNKQYWDSCSASSCAWGDDRRVLVSLRHVW